MKAQSDGGEVTFCRETERRTESFDTRGLGFFYCSQKQVLTAPLEAAHLSARPIFYGAVPIAWGTAFLRGSSDYTEEYRLALSQGVTYGVVLGLKHAVGRPRPYVTRALISRSGHYSRDQEEKYVSFPSGHAGISAALATSWSLSYPKWYVVGPGILWTVGVSLSRLHLGVHYPSDIIVGAAIGAGIATLVHRFRASLTPHRLRGSPPGATNPAPITIRIQF